MKPLINLIPDVPDLLSSETGRNTLAWNCLPRCLAYDRPTFRPIDNALEELTFAFVRAASQRTGSDRREWMLQAWLRSTAGPGREIIMLGWSNKLDFPQGYDRSASHVDFSNSSETKQDGTFGQAIAAAKASVALPTFAQSAGFREGRQLDALPVAALREHAHLASISVAPDS